MPRTAKHETVFGPTVDGLHLRATQEGSSSRAIVYLQRGTKVMKTKKYRETASSAQICHDLAIEDTCLVSDSIVDAVARVTASSGA